MKSRVEVVIIGGGIIGCSVAYHLAKKGVRDVAVIEMMPSLGLGESSVSGAMLMHQTGNEQVTRLAKESIKEYMKFKEELGSDLEFHNSGSILFTTKQEAAEKIHEQVEMQKRLGIDSRVVTRDEILELAPFINTDDIVLGAFCHLDGYVDPDALVEQYRKEASRVGVQFYTGLEATKVIIEGRFIEGVKTTNGIIKTRTLVNAAGGMGHLIAKSIGITLPMENDKRHIFVIGVSSKIKPFPILEDIDSKWYFHPEGTKNILFGVGPTEKVTIEKADQNIFMQSVDEEAFEELARYVLFRAPKLGNPNVVSGVAGIRSLTPDELPILGPVDQVQGFINCCGLSGFGITNAAICGILIAEWIVDGRTRIPLDPFLLARFKTAGT